MHNARAVSLLAALIAASVAIGCGGSDGAGDESARRADSASDQEIWDSQGVWVVSPTATFPAGGFGPTIQKNGFGWVALQIMDGATVLDEGSWSAWVSAWRQYVPHVGAWIVNRTDPVGEANLAAEKIAAYGFDFLIADAEKEYEYSQGASSCGECFGRSQQYIGAFRAKLPDLPAAISSYGRVDLADIDWRAWSDNGFHFVPQTYWNEYDIYQPSVCVERALNWIRPGGDGAPFWKANQVHPALGLWGGGATAYVSAEKYLDDLSASNAAYGQKGLSVYRGDMCPGGEWDVLGAAAPGSGSTGGGSTSGGSTGGGCSNQCADGAKQCLDGDRYIECRDGDNDGCTEWSEAYSCGTSWPGTVCSAGYCVGSSGSTGSGGGDCNACSAGGKQCVDNDLYQDCGDLDQNGCTEWSPIYSCSTSWPGTHCNNGWCVN